MMTEKIEPAFTLETIDKDIEEAEHELVKAEIALDRAMDDYNKATKILAWRIVNKELMIKREYETK